MSKGITIIEALIAVFILTVGIVAVLYMFPLGSRVAKSGQMITVAVELGQGKMEEEISKSYSQLTTGTVTENYGEIFDFGSYKRVTEISYYEGKAGIKKIEIAVYWKSPFGITEKNINLISLIVKR